MRRAGMVNVGQLVREAHGERPDERDGVMLVGFGSHRGTVIAGDEWGAPMRRMRVPAGRQGSWEDLLHRASARDKLLIFDGSDDAGILGLGQPLEHRAIGVVYDPDAERWGNYVPTIVPRRYDAFIYVDQSKALDPLHLPVHVGGDEPETYPSGM
jgi:erythromycin esterase-like protein